jgi:membrane protease YdiL (CAAX protease family)
MKKQLSAIEFAVIVLFFALPPVFTNATAHAGRTAGYPVSVFILAACAGILLYQMKRDGINNNAAIEENTSAGKKKLMHVMHTGTMLICFGLLCITASMLELAAAKIPATFSWIAHTDAERMTITNSVFGVLNFIAGTFCAAFYEEVLYRKYLPETLKALTGNRFLLLCEAAVFILFAAGHRYLGLMAVINAAVASVILRVCMIKTKSVWYGFAAHCMYNFCMMAVYAYLFKN